MPIADGDRLRLRRVADKLVQNAVAGEIAAIREIADRWDGKVPQAVDVSGDDPNITPKFAVLTGRTDLAARSLRRRLPMSSATCPRLSQARGTKQRGAQG
jgi:hypothetical protein